MKLVSGDRRRRSGAGHIVLAARGAFPRLAWRMLCHDPTFRGFLEFAAIAAIVLWFIHQPAIDALLPSLGGVGGTTSDRTPAVAASKPDRPLDFIDLMSTTGAYLFPRTMGLEYFTIDVAPFASSPTEAQVPLKRAAEEYILRFPDAALQSLDSADGDDPNVMFMRALAMAMPRTERALAVAHDGIGTEPAANLLEKAIAKGQPQAMGALGLLLLSSWNQHRDPSRGLELLKRAADAGDIGAARALGVVLHTGAFGAVDNPRAVQLLRRALDLGDARAPLQLAYLTFIGVGTNRDHAEAERLIRVAAERGEETAELILGVFYRDQLARGLISDANVPLHWLVKSAENGQPQSLEPLAEFYLTQHEDRKAARTFRRCASMLYEPCLYPYGALLEAGIGIDRDPVIAYAMFTMARAPERAAEVEKKMTLDQRQAAQNLVDLGREHHINWQQAVGEKDQEGCVAASTMKVCPGIDSDHVGIRLIHPL